MNNSRLSIGIQNLDQILNGGLIPENTYLVRGGPGSGKTTLGLHYLAAQDEKSILITLTESKDKLYKNALARGFNLEKIKFVDLSPSAKFVEDNDNYTVFPSDEVEQKPIIEKITKTIQKTDANRVYFDGLTQLRYLARDGFQFRKQILSLIQLAKNQKITLLISSEASENKPDDDLQFMCDGVINLFHKNDRRYVNISKFRGSDFLKGEHSFKITQNGIKVYHKIKSKESKKNIEKGVISSRINEIDRLLHGGIEKNTTTVISGASGVGKTTLGIQLLKAASERDEHSAIYTFEEDVATIINRSKSINIPISKLLEKEKLSLVKVNPLEYTPDEFVHKIKNDIEKNDTKIVMIDSVSGYKLAFGKLDNSRDEMVRNLHTLTNYLNNIGVTVLIINEIENITGDFKVTELGISYLADNIIFLRYLEMNGELRKAIGVLKKRLSDFENKMREFKITESGIKVGDPLTQLRGILTGNPEFISFNKKGSEANEFK